MGWWLTDVTAILIRNISSMESHEEQRARPLQAFIVYGHSCARHCCAPTTCSHETRNQVRAMSTASSRRHNATKGQEHNVWFKTAQRISWLDAEAWKVIVWHRMQTSNIKAVTRHNSSASIGVARAHGTATYTWRRDVSMISNSEARLSSQRSSSVAAQHVQKSIESVYQECYDDSLTRQWRIASMLQSTDGESTLDTGGKVYSSLWSRCRTC